MSTAALIPSDLVRVSKMAKEIHVHVNTFHRWREDGRDPLPALKVGGQWFISKAEFANWVLRRSQREER